MPFTPHGAASGREEVEEVNCSGTAETATPQNTESSIEVKKRSKKRNKSKPTASIDDVIESSSFTTATPTSGANNNPSGSMATQFLENSPTIETEAQDMKKTKAWERTKMMRVREFLTEIETGVKDVRSHKFWNTQPIARFDEEESQGPDGPVRGVSLEVAPPQLLDGFEWATLDLNDEKQLSEVYELLSAHYVEDSGARFRFNYSESFLSWALKSPGWIPEWHVGVRVRDSQKLIAFVSAAPVNLKVRSNIIHCSEVNFLCVHKKLRSKRLAPVLIKEITRRCNIEGVTNAVYTAGTILPKPVSTCRYYHRNLDWLKLYEVGFSSLPLGSTTARQVARYHLPTRASTNGLRAMESEDVDAVHGLLSKYLERFDMAPKFDKKEVEHWLLHKGGPGAQIIFTYVVEDGGHITDFFSFYALESSVIGNKEHKSIRAAYLFYYASEVAFDESPGMKKELKIRLDMLINDALILAKKFKFDVLNALTLLDNTLFLQELKFSPGNGQLHYYLFNWRTAKIKGGTDESNHIDEKNGSGIGIVML